MNNVKVFLLVLFQLCVFTLSINAQEESIARIWNEEVLNGIRNDFARPTVHARNLWHTSVAMYDIWAIYDSESEPYFMGNTVSGFEFEFDGIPESATPEEDIHEAISYVIYRLLFDRFLRSPGAGVVFGRMNALMNEFGYSLSFSSTDYQSGNPAALGNYIAEQIIAFGNQDNSNQANDYANIYYNPVNDPLLIFENGIMELNDPNRWQPLTLEVFIDQSGNMIPGNTPDFLSPEWGQVHAFALKDSDAVIYNRDNFDYKVYHDPGVPPLIDLEEDNESSDLFKWGFSLVSIWSSHLDPADGVEIDISPASIGNINDLPQTFADQTSFYNYIEGGDIGEGHDLNPVTNLPYEPNVVKRADYARVLAEFWADGPDSETPPGHWFTILNYVTDHPEFSRQYNGRGEELDPLEWDVKSYFMLGGAMHDCAVSTWGIKGYYDYLRPITAIRSMCERGQSSDPNLPSYDIGGVPLVPGYIELIDESDPLVGANMENLNKIKLYAWKGPSFIDEPDTDVAGVDWILAGDWLPYQRPSFVSPPFAGYVSGHSTFSRAAADVLAHITGSEFFPGGLAEFVAERNEFLVFEDGPSEDIVLQWATFRDASDQTSLSRIWGGIHPPADDIPGRENGILIAEDVIALAESFLFDDNDSDGFYSYIDCDDFDDMVNPSVPEVCDGIDNNCSKEIDDGLTILTYYLDFDEDGYGDLNQRLDTCLSLPPNGFVTNSLDCNDSTNTVSPDIVETCDGIDNNCNGKADEDIPVNRYYMDFDEDGFGDLNVFVDTCIGVPPIGFVANTLDCNDSDDQVNPNAVEVCDAIDNNCDGLIDEGLPLNRYYLDLDSDGYGNAFVFADTCISVPPIGYVDNFIDCDDSNDKINPLGSEICDGIDNNCNGNADEGLAKFIYFEDSDGDGFGSILSRIDTCNSIAPLGFVENDLDCDDTNPQINPNGIEIPDNGIDEDCSGVDLFLEPKVFPNPFADDVIVHFDLEADVTNFVYSSISGELVKMKRARLVNNEYKIDLSDLSAGIYYLVIRDTTDNVLYNELIVKQ